MPIDLNYRHEDKLVRLEISGRFDFSLRDAFNDAVTEALVDWAAKTIEIDLSQVEVMDSAALGMLLVLREKADTIGKAVVLVAPSNPAAKVLQVAQFNKKFQIRAAV